MSTDESAENSEDKFIEDTDSGTVKVEVPFTLKLIAPIKWGKDDEARETITVKRRLKAKDFKGMSPSALKFDEMFKLITKCTGESIFFVEELDGEDVMFLTKIVNGFLVRGPGIGKS